MQSINRYQGFYLNGVWVSTILVQWGSEPFFYAGGRTFLDPFYEKPWYSDAVDAAVGCLAVCPLAGVGLLESGAISVEGAATGYKLYGEGRLGQIRFFERDLILRLDVRNPTTHVNIEGRIFDWKFNFHIPPF